MCIWDGSCDPSVAQCCSISEARRGGGGEGGRGGRSGAGLSLRSQIFGFCKEQPLRTVPKDHQPPTATNRQPATAANRCQPPTVNCQPLK